MTPRRRHPAFTARVADMLVAGACGAGLLLLLAACTVGPNFVRPMPSTPAHWSGQALQADRVVEGPAALAAWWTQFHDPTLNSLIERSLNANLDLRTAVLRSQESLAQRDITAAGLLPSLSTNASYNRERISESTPEGSLLGTVGKFSVPGVGGLSIPNPYNQYQLGAAASWELDLFGRLRRSVEAANATVQVSVEDQHAVQVSLLGQVAQNYIALRGAQARRAIATENLATLEELLQLTQQRHAAGLNTELDVRNVIAQSSQARASLPAYDLQITQAIHALGDLLARPPEALRVELDAAAAVPPVPLRVPIGLPAELARRRPDIRQAEAKLHAATAQIGVAIGNLFPQLTLSAQGGFQSESVGSLVRWSSLFGSIGPTLQLPIFDRGVWKTVHLYDLKAQEAALSYQITVLNALHEVEDAAAAYSADQQQRQWLTDTVAQNRLALGLSQQRYHSGVIDFLDVLEAQRTLQQNQLALVTNTATMATDLVNLYRTLGGGWNREPPLSGSLSP